MKKKPHELWWSYVKSVVWLYAPTGTARDTLVTGRERGAVREAIAQTKLLPDGERRVEMLSRVFWERSHTLAGAAMCVPCSYGLARRWQQDFIRRVAKNLDLL